MSRYGFNLLDELALIARQDENFRRALPHGFYNSTERALFIEEFTKRLETLVGQVEISKLLDNSSAALRNSQLANNRSRFTDLIRLDRLSADSVISRRRGIDFQVGRNADHLIVKFAQQELSFPYFMSEALNSLLRDQPCAVGEINGLISEAGKLELVKRFVQAGLLTIEKV
jgi:hypothetical protein